MKKQEILKVVKSMLVDWQDSEDYKRKIKDVMVASLTSEGFCFWLISNTKNDQYLSVLKELYKDVLKPTVFGLEWYDTYIDNPKYNLVFVNRINHLQRTIKRLETEIANEA